jgi:hypothetical protein
VELLFNYLFTKAPFDLELVRTKEPLYTFFSVESLFGKIDIQKKNNQGTFKIFLKYSMVLEFSSHSGSNKPRKVTLNYALFKDHVTKT